MYSNIIFGLILLIAKSKANELLTNFFMVCCFDYWFLSLTVFSQAKDKEERLLNRQQNRERMEEKRKQKAAQAEEQGISVCRVCACLLSSTFHSCGQFGFFFSFHPMYLTSSGIYSCSSPMHPVRLGTCYTTLGTRSTVTKNVSIR